MYVKRNEHGQLMYYYQNVGNDAEDVRFDPDEIIEFKTILLMTTHTVYLIYALFYTY